MEIKKKNCERIDTLFRSLWNLWCIGTIVGIWPRFIEPRLISTKQHQVFFPRLSPALEGLRIVQLSDLHFSSEMPEKFLKKILTKVERLQPDLLVFTGDMITRSQLEAPERLLAFLQKFKAPYGCYAILGNHDYQGYPSYDAKGEYRVEEDIPFLTRVLRNFKRKNKKEIISLPLHDPLCQLLAKTPFQLLHNKTEKVEIQGDFLNICGLGDYWLGHCRPDIAFQHYDPSHFGLILTHNPDTMKFLQDSPGELVLSGHTHGGQVNLPWIWKKLSSIENEEYKRGWKAVDKKKLYINRGLGSQHAFRLFSLPEITLFTLRRA